MIVLMRASKYKGKQNGIFHVVQALVMIMSHIWRIFLSYTPQSPHRDELPYATRGDGVHVCKIHKVKILRDITQ